MSIGVAPLLDLRIIDDDDRIVVVAGMIVGFVAALLSFGLLKPVGEPAVDRAIAFESAMDEAKAKAEHDAAVAKGENPPPSKKSRNSSAAPSKAASGCSPASPSTASPSAVCSRSLSRFVTAASEISALA